MCHANAEFAGLRLPTEKGGRSALHLRLPPEKVSRTDTGVMGPVAFIKLPGEPQASAQNPHQGRGKADVPSIGKMGGHPGVRPARQTPATGGMQSFHGGAGLNCLPAAHHLQLQPPCPLYCHDQWLEPFLRCPKRRGVCMVEGLAGFWGDVRDQLKKV